MDVEGAELPLAPDEEQLTQQPHEVASATVVTDPLPSAEAPSAAPGIMKEEVDYSDPTETVTEVPTVDLLGLV